jgi:hypothetical protein
MAASFRLELSAQARDADVDTAVGGGQIARAEQLFALQDAVRIVDEHLQQMRFRSTKLATLAVGRAQRYSKY